MTFIKELTTFIKELVGGPSDFALGWALILLASLASLATIVFGVFRSLARYLRKDSILLKEISQLATETNIEYFKSLLGNPTFINEKGENREFIFARKNFYVQAITDSVEKVISFSVTTRNVRFNPSLSLGPFTINGHKLRVVLGETSFSALNLFNEPEKITVSIGAHNYYYSEQYYFGNPGNYQTYAFTLNQSGCFKSSKDTENLLDIKNPKREDLKKFREGTKINTYTVSASLGRGLKNVEFGPDYFQVRVLN